MKEVVANDESISKAAMFRAITELVVASTKLTQVGTQVLTPRS